MPNSQYIFIKYVWFVNIWLSSFFLTPLNGFIQVLRCNSNNLTSDICLHTFKWYARDQFAGNELELICFHTSIAIISTQLNCFNCYLTQFYLLFIIHLHTVKWFQVLLCITNNSIKQSFVYTQLNDQTVLFQSIQFSISHLFAHSLYVKQRTLSSATIPGHSGPESNGNEGVFHILQSFRTGAVPLD